MGEKESLEYLESELNKQVTSFDDSRRFYRLQHYRFTLATAVISAATTVFIGVGQILHSPALSILSLVFSAAITVVAAWDGFLRSRDLWVQKTDTWMSLQNLQERIKYSKAKYGDVLSQDQVDDFYKTFDQIVMGEHELWKKLRSTQASSTGGKSRSRI